MCASWLRNVGAGRFNATCAQVDVVQAMEPFVQLQIDKLILTPETSWQPSDFLPDLTQDDWVDQVRR